jgi:hypothetical protein
MFDSKQTLTTRLTDAADLMIDFATLGEYGLEPVGRTPRACEGGRQRPRPIADRQTFSEVLFPNRHRGAEAELEGGLSKKGLLRGPRRNGARKRGGLGASRPFAADGAA